VIVDGKVKVSERTEIILRNENDEKALAHEIAHEIGERISKTFPCNYDKSISEAFAEALADTITHKTGNLYWKAEKWEEMYGENFHRKKFFELYEKFSRDFEYLLSYYGRITFHLMKTVLLSRVGVYDKNSGCE
jgi:AICAR transformylase/IMP cyclohydrolase PurH